MGTVLWLGILAVALVLAGMAVRPMIPHRPRPERDTGASPEVPERPPMASEERRAWWSLSITGIFVVAALVLAVVKGPEVFLDATGRRPTTALMLGTALAYIVGLLITSWIHRRERVVVDERDRLIMLRALGFSWIAVLTALAAWSVVLTEAYRGAGAIPPAYPYLVFFSTLMVGIGSRDIGTLLGYAGWSTDAEG